MSEHLIYLLRHGETEWSRTGRHTGRTDLPLTERGELAAGQAGRGMLALRGAHPALVRVSPRQRATRTAHLAGLNELGEIRTEPLLAEWDYGDYEGLSTTHIHEQVPNWTLWTHGVPGGETASEVAERADTVLDHARTAERDVILVGHGHFSRCLIARWLGQPVTAGVQYALDAASVTVLGHERGVPQLVRHNVPPPSNA